MQTREKALRILGLPATANLIEIKQAFQTHALEKHPHRHPNQREKHEAEFKMLSDAYSQLINDEPKRETKEFSPSWPDIIQSELKETGTGTIATTDERKPSIQDFFLSLKRSLYKLEQKVLDSKENKFIEDYEGITLEQQRANRTYTLKCINAANNIILLLEDYIKTNDPDHWKITETLRSMQLTDRLAIEFNKFGDDELLKICDANTFELAQLFLNYSACLRDPLNNFKSTEDKLHLTLLDAASTNIKKYHEATLHLFHQYYVFVARQKSPFYESQNQLSRRIREYLANPEECTSEKLRLLKEDINRAKEYVINHCQYLDNLYVFNPLKVGYRSQFGLRGQYRRRVLDSMFSYNCIPGAEPFSEEELGGYKSFQEFQDKEYEIYLHANIQGTPAHLIPIASQQFIDVHRKKMPSLPPAEEKTERKEGEARTSAYSSMASPTENKFVPPTIIHATKLIDRENDLIKILGDLTSQVDGMNYMREEKTLAMKIDEMKDCPQKNQAKIILSAIQNAIKTTKNLLEIKELSTCLQDARLAIQDGSTKEEVNRLIATAQKIKTNPSYKWKAIGAAMMVLGATLIAIFGLGATNEANTIKAGTALFAGGAALFYYGRSRKTSTIVLKAAEKIALRHR
jgi:hypothetical protein